MMYVSNLIVQKSTASRQAQELLDAGADGELVMPGGVRYSMYHTVGRPLSLLVYLYLAVLACWNGGSVSEKN